jgi:molybdopterin converting factor subunit 1
MTTATVRLFARFRDLLDRESIDVALTRGTVAELRRTLGESYPVLRDLLTRSRIAVNGEFVDEANSVTDRDEIALIPPVSGGAL